MQVDAVKVLDNSLLEGQTVVHLVLEQHGHDLELGDCCSAPASFAGDELVLAGFTFNRSNDDRLQDAQFCDGRGEGLQAFVVEGLSRLKRVGPNGVTGT